MNPYLQQGIPSELQPAVEQLEGLVSDLQKLSGTSSQTFLIASGVTIAVLFAAFYFLVKVIGKGSKGHGGPDSRQLRREAKRQKSRGNYQEAGELFESAGDFDGAAEMYQRAESYRYLGHLYERMKDWSAAAGAYESSRDVDKASEMYQRSGQLRKAAEILRDAKRDASAAELFERVGEFNEAARLYERSGFVPKAAACYERSKETRKAAELFERHFLQEKVRFNLPSTTSNTSQKAELTSYALQSGRLYLKLGDPNKAAHVFEMAGMIKEAADAYTSANDRKKAAELYYAMKEYRKAAALYQQIGKDDKAYQIEGEMHLGNGNFLEAAQMYEKANDFLQSADLYEKANKIEKAAEMYRRGGDTMRANDLYQTLGDPLSSAKALEAGKHYREAAQQYINAGEFEQAARMLEEIGDYFEAGLIFSKLGRAEDTIAFLQKVDTQSEHYFEASLMLGRLFMDRGMLDTAKERFMKLISKKEISAETLEPFYHLAQIHEKNKEYSHALALYEKILAENYKFKDVPERLRSVKESLKKEELVGGSVKTAESDSQNTRYRIGQKIGQGGMGVVFRAEDTLLNRTVAYKVLPPSLSDNPTVIDNFMREARVAAGINHTNIVTIFDTGMEGAEPYIVMEIVEGVTLKQILERTSFMGLKDTVGVIKQVCLALDHAHKKNVIHRDIKPANIMIRKDRVVKIMDFGLAKILTTTAQEGTSVKGTPLYMSPEQIRGERVDHRTDIYSLGCTMYRMLVGRAPFMEGDVYYHHLNSKPAPPSSRNPRIPEFMDRIILKCLEKDPARRYQAAGEILRDMEAGYALAK
jgi:tetratricopeptide (TPR) repeat protein